MKKLKKASLLTVGVLSGIFLMSCGVGCTDDKGVKISDTQEFIDAIVEDPYVNISLESDLDFSDIDWEPLVYHGVLNGNNHTISGIKVDEAEGDCIGMFSYGKFSMENIKITDLTVNYYGTGSNVGGLVGKWGIMTERVNHGENYLLRGYLKNVQIDGEVNAMGAKYVGGVCGYQIYGKTYDNCIENVVSDVDVYGGEVVGGVIGYFQVKEEASAGFGLQTVDENVNLYGVENQGDVKAVKGYAGGIIGDASTLATYKNCKNSGKVVAKAYVGGIVGQSKKGVFQSCSNTGCIAATATDSLFDRGYAGGIIGCQTSGQVIQCKNSGEVQTVLSGAGGILGALKETAEIIACENSGKVMHTQDNMGGSIGGIIGVLGGKGHLVDSCVNTGEIIGSSYVAGIIGHVDGEFIGSAFASGEAVRITKCKNSGKITADAYKGVAGGIYVSSAAETITSTDNENTGEVIDNAD